MTITDNIKDVADDLEKLSISASNKQGTPKQLWQKASKIIRRLNDSDARADALDEFNDSLVLGIPANHKSDGLVPGAVYRLSEDDGYTRDDDTDLADDLDQLSEFVAELD